MILRQAALCCLMIASAPEQGPNKVRLITDSGQTPLKFKNDKHFLSTSLKKENVIKKNYNTTKQLKHIKSLSAYLQASCAQLVPRRPLSGSPRSERGIVWPAHCPAMPATHPDCTPPCMSRTDCCQCPPGTSAGRNKERDGGKLSSAPVLLLVSLVSLAFYSDVNLKPPDSDLQSRSFSASLSSNLSTYLLY